MLDPEPSDPTGSMKGVWRSEAWKAILWQLAKALRVPVAILSLLSHANPSHGQITPEQLFKKFKLLPQAGSVMAPGFETENLRGEAVRLANFKGKLLLLNFWATWCPPCRLEMPAMEMLYQEFKEHGLAIVAMNFAEGPEPIRKFAKEQNLSYPILLDKKGEIAKAYGVFRLPETIVIGRNGNILAKSTGYKDWYDNQTRELVSLLLRDETVLISGGQAAGETSVSPANPTERNPGWPYAVFASIFLAVLGFFYFWTKKMRRPSVH